MAKTPQVEVRPGGHWRVFTVSLAATWANMPPLRECLQVEIVNPLSNAEDIFVSYAEDASSADRAIFWPGRAQTLGIDNPNTIWARAETSAATIEIWVLLR